MCFHLLIGLFCFTGLLAQVVVLAQAPVNYSPIYPANKTLTTVTIRDNFYGTRNVTYFVTSNGLAVIDGDVVYGTLQDLIAHTINNSSDGSVHARAFSAPNTWPNAVITYKYDNDATELVLGSIVSEAIRRWRDGAPYLTFTATSPNGPEPTNGIVTITSKNCDGCHATIGFVASNPLSMNLQQACPDKPGVCGADEANHEFGHVLGLRHEHQRPDREEYVHYDCRNLDPACDKGSVMPAGSDCCSSVSGCCATSSNFDIQAGPGFDFNGPYDINSTMEYRADAFALPHTETLTSVKADIVVPVNNIGFSSPIDFDRICKLYAAWCPKAQACAAVSCPTGCVHIPVCDGAPKCIRRPEICCVGREWNQQCDAKRSFCTSQGCDFLL